MEIVIYDASWNVLPWPSFAKISRRLGVILLYSAFGVALYAATPILIQEARYRLQPKPLETSVKATFSQITNDEETIKRQLAAQEAASYGLTPDFSLVIPKINAAAQIIPNVDPGNKEEYTDALKQGVAHAYGTGFPGSKGTIFIFSHSTNAEYNIDRFNAVFYLLKELEPNDKIIIFYAGRKFDYQVTGKQTVEADDTGWLTSDSNEERLVLQTCWPPGTSLKRLIVIAKPI